MEGVYPVRSISRSAHRIAVAAFFFLLGLCFASWASRIPTIRQQLALTEAGLGMVLLALPLGSLLSLPLSGWLIDKIGSKKILIAALLLYSIVLAAIGWAPTTISLMAVLFLFGMVGNTVNIAVNTQAVGVEALYQRSIMASFHGLWSVAGFTGAAIGTVMIGRGVIPFTHFVYIAAAVVIIAILCSRYALPADGNRRAGQPVFAWPDKSLLHLGLIAFCSMMCEGAMFDWSGVYFETVVVAEKNLIGAGYTAFMLTMAAGRFIADRFVNRFGVRLTLQCSGLLTASGLLIAVIFPNLISSILAFLLVGFGVSSVVPLVYSIAGKSKVLSPGMALAAVSTIGFLGFLLGPPLIGFIAGATSLRLSFGVIAAMGLCVTLLASFGRDRQY